ncbi:prophage tail fiber N-terminal domain-containing protein [Escherichia coli]|uniref:prophage tail fiber N-terminal domain-containing protein n=1 Tax=Escherichia coli TaxID=562 RepID=UPI0039785178
MDVEYGQYSVILFGGGLPAVTCRDHHRYEDSQPGTLNDFLGAMSEMTSGRRHCAVLN